MKCPVCEDVPLSISSREGIEIDHCPQCRGVWLDRGELDKIIDRAAPSVMGAVQGAPPVQGQPAPPQHQAPPPQPAPQHDPRFAPNSTNTTPYGQPAPPPQPPPYQQPHYPQQQHHYDDRGYDPRYDDRRRDDDRGYDPRYKKKKKKGSFLEDIFDFD